MKQEFLIYICKELLKRRHKAALIKFKEGKELYSPEDIRLFMDFDRIGSFPLYRKYLGTRRLKLIIQKMDVNSTTVYILRHIFNVSRAVESRQYHLCRYDPENWLKHNKLSTSDMKEIKKLILPPLPPPPPPQVPDELKIWFEPPKIEFNFDLFEGERWKEKIGYRNYLTIVKDIYRILQDIEQGNRRRQCDINGKTVFFTERDGVKVYFKIFPRSGTGGGISGQSFIAYLINFQTNDEKVDITVTDIPDDYDSAEKKAARAYESWVLYDDSPDMWFKIEDIHSGGNKTTGFDAANLALSSGEIEVLKNPELPMFINGQAGSGKTTILISLFAKYVSWQLKKHRKETPILLAYSSNLIQEMRTFVKMILEKNPNYSDTPHSNLKETLESCILPFQELIKKRIIPEFAAEFPEEKRIDFSLFRKLYSNPPDLKIRRHACRSPSARKYSPELAWYVIRTFIKGYFPERDLDADDFPAIKKKSKISENTFLDIYEHIYIGWYNNLTGDPLKHGKKFWDDLDLIRFALKNVIIPGKEFERYPVIFCDEAQDFTNIELFFILKLSMFSGYDLSRMRLLPFAFAGDPLQTVNPTGFNWDWLKSAFYDQFRKSNLKFKRKDNESILRIQPLDENHRSSEKIVKLANLILFCRSVLERQKIKPQRARRETGVSPLLFQLGNLLQKEYLKDSATHIIVPEHTRDLQRDYPELADALDIANNPDVVERVDSPLTLKGLELPKVILFNFGDRMIRDINALMKSELSEDEKMQVDYLFNNLYVAITRARENLYIIDTKEGIEKLWNQLLCSQSISLFRSHVPGIPKPDFWSVEHIGCVNKGRKTHLEEFENRDYLVNAEKFADSGRKQNDPEFMNRAAFYYRRSGDSLQSMRCKAESYMMQKEYDLAGETWITIGSYDKAGECFWKGRNWKRLSDLRDDIPHAMKYRAQIADFMLQPNFNNLEKTFFRSALVNKMLPEVPWLDIVGQINTVVLNNLKMAGVQPPDNWSRIGTYLEEIVNRGFSGKQVKNTAARCAFRAKNYRKAVTLWESIGLQNIEEYFISKMQTAADPVSAIEWAIRIEPSYRHENKSIKSYIMDTWRWRRKSLNEGLIRKIGEYFYNHGDYSRALQFLSALPTNNRPLAYYKAEIKQARTSEDKFKWLVRSMQIPYKRKERTTEVIEIWRTLRDRYVEENPLSFDDTVKLVDLLMGTDASNEAYLLLKQFTSLKAFTTTADLFNKKKFPNQDPMELIRLFSDSITDEYDYITQKKQMESRRKKDIKALREFIGAQFELFDYTAHTPETICSMGRAFEIVIIPREDQRQKLVEMYAYFRAMESLPEALGEWVNQRLFLNKERLLRVAIRQLTRSITGMREDRDNSLLSDKDFKLNKKAALTRKNEIIAQLETLGRELGIRNLPKTFPPPLFPSEPEPNSVDTVSFRELLLQLIHELRKDRKNEQAASMLEDIQHARIRVIKMLWHDSVRNRIRSSSNNMRQLIQSFEKRLTNEQPDI